MKRAAEIVAVLAVLYVLALAYIAWSAGQEVSSELGPIGSGIGSELSQWWQNVSGSASAAGNDLAATYAPLDG